MGKKLNEEIKISFLKRLTGRQDPTLKGIIASIIIAIIMFLVTLFAGFFLKQAMIRPSANVVFHPYVENSSYLPIIITNGPKPLTRIELKVKTCNMKDYETFPIPNLIEYQEYPVRLKDENTIYALDKISNNIKCDPLNVSPNTQCFIKTYVVDEKIYAPPQKCKKYRCGYCKYNLNLKSNEFSHNFSSFFFSPIEIKTFSLDIIPNNSINVSKEEMVPYSPIGLSLFSPYDFCMFDNNNDYERCKDLPIIPIIEEPITLSISPTNKSLGNLSIIITQTIQYNEQ